MNQLSKREKALLILGALAVVAALLYFGVPWLQTQIGGGEVAEANQQELEQIQAVLKFRHIAEQMEPTLRAQVGLLGERVIPDDLLQQLRDKVTLEPDPEHPDRINLNRATREQLHALGLDKDQAERVWRYRTRRGRITSLDELRELKKGLFEEQDEQAVILTRLAQAVREAGIEPKNLMQIEPRPLKSTRPVPLPASVRSDYVTQIYLQELQQEAEILRQQQEAIGDEAQQVRASKRWFPPLPTAIPIPWRLKLIEIIQKRQGDLGVRLTEKEASNVDEALMLALAGLHAPKDQVEIEVLDKGRRGFLGLGKRPVKILAISQDPEEGLVAFFRRMLPREMEAAPDRATQEAALMTYVRQCAKVRHQLTEILKKVPLSYKPRLYLVEMSFKADMGKLVRVVEKIESNHRWIRVRDLKISIADEKQTLLQANLTMIATVI